MQNYFPTGFESEASLIVPDFTISVYTVVHVIIRFSAHSHSVAFSFSIFGHL